MLIDVETQLLGVVAGGGRGVDEVSVVFIDEVYVEVELVEVIGAVLHAEHGG